MRGMAGLLIHASLNREILHKPFNLGLLQVKLLVSHRNEFLRSAFLALAVVGHLAAQTPGGEIVQSTQSSTTSGFGEYVASIVDLDGDGIAEIIASNPNLGPGFCFLDLSDPSSALGVVSCQSGFADICSVPDMDGDGLPDAVLVDTDSTSGGAIGVLRVFGWDPNAIGGGAIKVIDQVTTTEVGVSEFLGPIAFLHEDTSGVSTFAIRSLISGQSDPVVVTFEYDTASNPPYSVTKLDEISEPGTWNSVGSFGESLASAGTSTPAVFIGAPRVAPYGKVAKFRASDGSLLKEYKASPTGQLAQTEFGSHVASIDLDMDGDLELLVGTDQPTTANIPDKILIFDQFGTGQPDSNHLVQIDGANGFLEPAPWGLRAGEDYDQDGRPDYMATSDHAGGVSVYSGLDSELLYSERFVAAGTLHSATFLGGPQVVVFGHPDYNSGTGRILLEDLDPYLTLSDLELSASASTDVDFHVDFPASEAGKAYRIVLSAGRSPYAQISGVDLPVEGAGGWYWDSVNGNLPSYFVDFDGLLDASGDATGTLDVSATPAGALAALVGIEFSVCVVAGSVSGTVDLSSYRAILRIVS